ncbi:hypothetical protein [Streptomyces canus]|uniref:hypothetical protein n=1 Tax=Streptomyces canus TaxID=58343 RepID=UPI00372388E2
MDGKLKRVSERHLGTADEIASAMTAREGATLPQRSSHLAFGDVASVWRVLDRLDVAGIVDAVVGARRADAAASTGTYLAPSALNRVVAP